MLNIFRLAKQRLSLFTYDIYVPILIVYIKQPVGMQTNIKIGKFRGERVTNY